MFKMPKGGIKELLASKGGREKLEKYKQEHADDFLQPSDPRFKEVYGDKEVNAERIDKAKKALASMEWELMLGAGVKSLDFKDKPEEALRKIDEYKKRIGWDLIKELEKRHIKRKNEHP